MKTIAAFLSGALGTLAAAYTLYVAINEDTSLTDFLSSYWLAILFFALASILLALTIHLSLKEWKEKLFSEIRQPVIDSAIEQAEKKVNSFMEEAERRLNDLASEYHMDEPNFNKRLTSTQTQLGTIQHVVDNLKSGKANDSDTMLRFTKIEGHITEIVDVLKASNVVESSKLPDV